jgi:Flp pilus assembly protein TadG
VRRFARKEDGAATIEAVLWLPVFVLIMALAVDVTMIFHAHSRVLRVVQDVNRAVSVGRIEDTEDAEDKMVQMLPNYDYVEADVAYEDGIITSTVTVPVTSVVAVGIVNSLLGHDIIVQTVQYAEQ